MKEGQTINATDSAGQTESVTIGKTSVEFKYDIEQSSIVHDVRRGRGQFGMYSGQGTTELLVTTGDSVHGEHKIWIDRFWF